MKPADTEPRSALTFDWSLRESRARAFFLALVLAFMVGLISFVLFQITNSISRKPEAPSQAIIILDPASLAAQRLIDRANDQSFLLLADNNAHEQPQTTLAIAAPVFEPGFKNFRLRLRDLGQTQAPELRPRLFAAAHPLLPPISTPAPAPLPAAATAKKAAKLVAEVSQELQARWQPTTRAIPSALMQMNASLTYRIAVDPRGCVITALPLDESADEFTATSTTSSASIEELQRYIRSLRFKPEPTAPAPQWAMLTLSWQKDAQP